MGGKQMIKFLAAVALTSIAMAAVVRTTRAHAAFVTAMPAPDSTVAVVPGQVTVVFTETLTRTGTSVIVAGPNGAAVSGATSISGNSASAPLNAAGAGVYTVN